MAPVQALFYYCAQIPVICAYLFFSTKMVCVRYTVISSLAIITFVGLAFWKANLRKLFAVSTMKRDRKRKKLSMEDIVSIDDDDDESDEGTSNSAKISTGILFGIDNLFNK